MLYNDLEGLFKEGIDLLEDNTNWIGEEQWCYRYNH